jgi:hypothetical protein
MVAGSERKGANVFMGERVLFGTYSRSSSKRADREVTGYILKRKKRMGRIENGIE